MRLRINSYEKCIPIKEINGKQYTLVWYADDNKVLHEDENVVTEVINEIKQHWEGLAVHRGKQLTFLKMAIEFNDDKTVSISTPEYIDETIK